MRIQSTIEAKTITLTKQEKTIVDKIAEGKSSKEIGVDLDIKLKTVEVHRHRIFKKMGCKNSVQLIAELIRKKIIE